MSARKHTAERVANARLMSKAPELLGVLEEALGELAQWHEYYHPECTGCCPTVDIVLRAREIVRQATGRNSIPRPCGRGLKGKQ